jgi:uncharacterized membrane protein
MRLRYFMGCVCVAVSLLVSPELSLGRGGGHGFGGGFHSGFAGRGFSGARGFSGRGYYGRGYYGGYYGRGYYGGYGRGYYGVAFSALDILTITHFIIPTINRILSMDLSGILMCSARSFACGPIG